MSLDINMNDNEFKNLVNYIIIYLSRNNIKQTDFIKVPTCEEYTVGG